MLVLAVDANFRLKNRIRPNEINDPSLGSGWAYWVEPEGYQEHVKKYVKETDMTTCLAFAALLQKDTRMTSGLRVSGVGGCVCARHECMRPNGLGDLQKGERYCNMDWIVFSAILSVVVLALTISYDIACQWKVHLPERMARLPSHMHKDLSQMTIHFLTNRASARSMERASSVYGPDLTPPHSRTKEMGLGNRADTIDDRLDNHNFLKNMRQGDTLQRRLLVAREERRRQVAAFQAVSEGISPALQKEWKAQVRAWQDDKTQPNPYVLPSSGVPTETEIRLQLQKEERDQNTDGRASIAGSSATSFIAAGIQIEDAQYRIREMLALPQDRARFRDLQAVYMPGAAASLAEAEATRDPNLPPPLAEDVVLMMPSSLATPAAGCLAGVAEVEERLRVAECENSLSETRFTLHGKRWLIAHRNAHVTGQLRTTKTAKLIERVGVRADRYIWRYRRGYAALLGLGALGRFPKLRELTPADVQLPEDLDGTDLDATRKLALAGAGRGARPPRNMPSASRRVMSWIWTAPGAFDADEAALHEGTQRPFSLDFARSSLLSSDACGMDACISPQKPVVGGGSAVGGGDASSLALSRLVLLLVAVAGDASAECRAGASSWDPRLQRSSGQPSANALWYISV
ncbi:CxC2 domain-containing protein [Mycena kentingensis (nom. inval.)]|nr:CxC2 domain-containing protein [Mycena kentingensis (nom. inval.)]